MLRLGASIVAGVATVALAWVALAMPLSPSASDHTRFCYELLVGLIAGVAVVAIIVRSISDETQRRRSDENVQSLYSTITQQNELLLSGNQELIKTTVAEIRQAVPGTLVYRGLELVSRLSEIVEPFLKQRAPLISKLQVLAQLGDNHPALSKLGFTRDQVNVAMFQIELDAMKKYRDGNYQGRISKMTDEFAAKGIHDEFMDAFKNLEAREPFRILEYRDGLNRLIRRFAETVGGS